MKRGKPGVPRKRKLKVYRPDLGCWQLELTQGQWALVDSQDIDRVGKLAWSAYYTKRRRRYITLGNPGTVGYTGLGRAILEAPKGSVVDHINGDPLDNRRCNLRITTQAMNTRNAANYRGGTSQFKGVCVTGPAYRKPWKAQIQVNKKKIALGTFETEMEAAKAYDEAAKKLHGDFARLNFPNSERTE